MQLSITNNEVVPEGTRNPLTFGSPCILREEYREIRLASSRVSFELLNDIVEVSYWKAVAVPHLRWENGEPILEIGRPKSFHVVVVILAPILMQFDPALVVRPVLVFHTRVGRLAPDAFLEVTFSPGQVRLDVFLGTFPAVRHVVPQRDVQQFVCSVGA